MPDSISGLFGAFESDIRWSKLFLVPRINIKTRKYEAKYEAAACSKASLKERRHRPVIPSSFFELACDGWPMSTLMDLRGRRLVCPMAEYGGARLRHSDTFGEAQGWFSRSSLTLKRVWESSKQSHLKNINTVWLERQVHSREKRDYLMKSSHLHSGSVSNTVYVSIGKFSMVTSESSNDFLCFRLQRLLTSSDTVSKAETQTSTLDAFIRI